MPLDDLTVFDFEDAAVRIIARDGEPWFVAADVCRILELGNTGMAISRLDDDEKGVTNVDTLGGRQEMSIISESGLYALVFTSRKPEAKRFRKWVTGTVLPAIRRHGVYVHAAPDPEAMPDMARQDVSNWLGMVREARLLKGPGAAARMWAKSPLPPLDEDPQGVDFTHHSASVEGFLAACTRVTGNPDDRVTTADLWRRYRGWSADRDEPPLSERSFHKRLSALAGRWRCPETGKRFGRMKVSTWYCTGLVMVVGA